MISVSLTPIKAVADFVGVARSPMPNVEAVT